jgi:hypothetical protein
VQTDVDLPTLTSIHSMRASIRTARSCVPLPAWRNAEKEKPNMNTFLLQNL